MTGDTQSPGESWEEVIEQALQVVKQAAADSEHWSVALDQALGVNTPWHTLLREWERQKAIRSEAYGQIQTIISEMRLRPTSHKNEDRKAARVITVRMPASMHELLCQESRDMRTSLNKLCITKLLQHVRLPEVP